MIIFLNGEKREIARAASIAEMVEELALPALAVLIEHNGIALRREEWTDAKLNAEDRVEVLRIVAGG